MPVGQQDLWYTKIYASTDLFESVMLLLNFCSLFFSFLQCLDYQIHYPKHKSYKRYFYNNVIITDLCLWTWDLKIKSTDHYFSPLVI